MERPGPGVEEGDGGSKNFPHHQTRIRYNGQIAPDWGETHGPGSGKCLPVKSLAVRAGDGDLPECGQGGEESAGGEVEFENFGVEMDLPKFLEFGPKDANFPSGSCPGHPGPDRAEGSDERGPENF